MTNLASTKLYTCPKPEKKSYTCAHVPKLKQYASLVP